MKDYGVPDTVKSMSWCGENICIGFRKEYMILNSSTGASSEVFSSGRISPPLVVPLPSGGFLLGKVKSVSFYIYFVWSEQGSRFWEIILLASLLKYS